MTHPICRMLPLSTAHLTPLTCTQILPALADHLPLWPKGDYGWFLFADIEIDAFSIGLPEDLNAILRHA